MRILIISDSHGRTENIEFLKSKGIKPDLIIHCGDGSGDFDFISDFFKCRIAGVRGNCDIFTSEPRVLNIDIEGKLLHIEHGDRLPVYSDRDLLGFASDNGYDVVLYGHTHHQKCLFKDGRYVVNPGSISRPRDGFPSYTILDTDGKGGFSFRQERV